MSQVLTTTHESNLRKHDKKSSKHHGIKEHHKRPQSSSLIESSSNTYDNRKAPPIGDVKAGSTSDLMALKSSAIISSNRKKGEASHRHDHSHGHGRGSGRNRNKRHDSSAIHESSPTRRTSNRTSRSTSHVHRSNSRHGLYHSQEISKHNGETRHHAHSHIHHHKSKKHKAEKGMSDSISSSESDHGVPNMTQSAVLPRKLPAPLDRARSSDDLVDDFLHHEGEVLGDFLKNKGGSVVNDATELLSRLMSEFSKVSSGLQRPNVLLTGITGAGKSSLINAIFGKEIAKTGAGVPITQHFTKYASDDMRIVIYDSKGLEHGQFEDFIDTTNDFFDAHQIGNRGESADAIHVIWYVMNSAHSRFEPFEQRICKELFNRAPLIFLLNKADIGTVEDRNNLRKIITDMNLPNCVGVFDVMAAPSKKYRSVEVCSKCASDDLVIRKRFGTVNCLECGNTESIILNDGLSNVIESTVKVLPEVVRDAFVSAQTVSFALKEKNSRIVIEDFWSDFHNVRTRSKLMKQLAKMMARLSIVWEFKRHGHVYGATMAKDLVSALNWKDQMNLLLHKKMIVQRRHTSALGILWNRCLRDLATCVFNNWSKAPDVLVGDKVSNVCTSLFQSCFSQFNEENLIMIEECIDSSDLESVLDKECAQSQTNVKLSDKQLKELGALQ